MYLRFILISFFSFIIIGCANNNKLPEKCFEKAEIGICRAYFIKYYYNQENQKCEKFVYGGCGGNVPFETLKECKNSCEE